MYPRWHCGVLFGNIRGPGFQERKDPHYLLFCPRYTEPRRLLQAKLRRDAYSIPFLLGTRTGIPHLLRYVSNTKRLKATFGEVRPENDLVLKEKTTKERSQPRRNNEAIDN